MELKAIRVFADLCHLLDDYGPAWYSEEVHDRAHRALLLLQDLHGLSRIRSDFTDPAHPKPICRSCARDGMDSLSQKLRIKLRSSGERILAG